MDTTTIVFEIAKMAGTGVVAATFTAWFTIRDHRFKKWWELRAAAYQQVIEALSDVVYVFSVHFDSELRGVDVSDVKNEKLASMSNESFAKIRKAADAGAFLFSDEANALLGDFQKSLDEEHQSYFEHIDGVLFSAKKCLKNLVAQSRKDLSLHQSFFIWK
ncbi:hypothetical protein [Herbaspirillum rubrisubalbicans]|uniref:Uncharacterized protein n=1 Tax=Herbaspirillum rubrisubalbicans TaxID=80842 RepID=A0ABX9BUN8_9BURK|nr:hypothetical protein [Herbaspirillum rubrisubalbicans]RAM61473.1 hypothetical protein RB24_24965 [Herbaspirillum rubrisubalbicans]